MKLIPENETTSILIKGKIGSKFTSRSFHVTGDDVEYKMAKIITVLYRNTRLDDPFAKTKLHLFSIYINNNKITTGTHLTLDEFCTLIKEYIEFERWNDVL